MQQSRNDEEKVGRQDRRRWFVHTSNRMQSFVSVGYESLALASECVADTIIDEMHEVTGYRIESPALLAMTDEQVRELPDFVRMVHAELTSDTFDGMADSDDVHGMIAGHVAKLANVNTIEARETWEVEYRGLRVRVQRADSGVLQCPECHGDIWDVPHGHKLAKCWNSEAHESGAPIAFDTLPD